MKAVAMRRLCTGMMAGALLLATGCVEDAPPKQTPTGRVEMTGTATGGITAGPGESVYEVSARGTAGRLRTSASSVPSLQYAVSLTDLAGPYALSALVQDENQAVRVYTVATSQGRANLTPLTSLLVAQLYGQDPAAAFQGFGPAGSTDATRITSANLAGAQARLTAFVQEELGIDIPATTGDFVTAPFVPVAGDPMYDAIAAVFGRLAELDITPEQFTASVAQASRLCLTESADITIADGTTPFCPQTKSATAADDDADRFDYVYVDRHGNTLTVTVDGDSVLSVRYDHEAGVAYACENTACGAISLDEMTGDLTRPMHFGNLVLYGDGGNARIDGTLTGAIPGVTLPVLPCDDNRFFVVSTDRSVVAACVDPDQYGFGIGAYLGDFLGLAPSRVRYEYALNDGSDPTRPKVSVVTDANDAVLAVQFVDFEPDEYSPRRIYGCRLAACNGITLGEVTENADLLYPPIQIRTITFQDTVLTGHDEDGVDTGDSVSLTASLNTAYYDWVTGGHIMPIEFPPDGSCGSGNLPVAGNADGTTFDLCLTPDGPALEQPSGDVLLTAGRFDTDSLRVLLRGEQIVQATVSIRNQPLGFICNGAADCAGITVSAPDSDGLRTLQFDGAVLYEALLDRIAGTRSLRLEGGPVTFDALVPAP